MDSSIDAVQRFGGYGDLQHLPVEVIRRHEKIAQVYEAAQRPSQGGLRAAGDAWLPPPATRLPRR